MSVLIPRVLVLPDTLNVPFATIPVVVAVNRAVVFPATYIVILPFAVTETLEFPLYILSNPIVPQAKLPAPSTVTSTSIGLPPVIRTLATSPKLLIPLTVSAPTLALPVTFAYPFIFAPVPVIVNVALPAELITTLPLDDGILTLLFPLANGPIKLAADKLPVKLPVPLVLMPVPVITTVVLPVEVRLILLSAVIEILLLPFANLPTKLADVVLPVTAKLVNVPTLVMLGCALSTTVFATVAAFALP